MPSGKLVPDPACTLCKGHGEIFMRSDLKRQELIFEAAGLTKTGGGGVNVQVNQGVAIGGQGGFLDRFVTATDESAFDIEGEAVKEASDEPTT